jgi:hypothetical protein
MSIFAIAIAKIDIRIKKYPLCLKGQLKSPLGDLGACIESKFFQKLIVRQPRGSKVKLFFIYANFCD